MSRWWLITVAALIAGGLLGTMMLTDPGYVVVSWGDFAVETSLWFGLLVLVGIVLATRFLLLLIRLMRGGVSKVSGLAESRRANRAREATGKGLLLWAEGDWQQSLRLLADGAVASTVPLVNHLFAAASAQKLGDAETRDHHLREAVVVEPAGEFAISLVRAGYLVESGKPDEALSLLKLLYSRAPRHPMVARQLLSAAETAGDFVLALQVLASPALRGVLDESKADEMRLRLWKGRVGSDASDVVWHEVPAALKLEPELVLARVDRLERDDASPKAAELLDATLRQNWKPALVARFGALSNMDAGDQLRQAEPWLSRHGQDPLLLLVLGRLSLRAGDLDKAESFLKSLLRLQPGPEVAAELGRLFLRRGDAARAAEFFQQALDG
jgi:HemY protein